jgi:hypothetical protein
MVIATLTKPAGINPAARELFCEGSGDKPRRSFLRADPMDYYFEFDFALHITWTTYGTWLPGDERGYVSNTLQENRRYARRENQLGRPYTKDSAITRQRAAALQKHPTAFLTPQLALAVAEELVEAAAKRDWYIARAAIMAALTCRGHEVPGEWTCGAADSQRHDSGAA